MPPRLIPTQILALEASTDVVRGVLLRRGLGRVTAVASVEVPRQRREVGDESLLLPAEIMAVAGRCEAAGSPCVVVSERVSSIPLSMTRSRYRRLRPEQIREALRWEAEAYLAFPPAEAMAGYEPLARGEDGGRELPLLGHFLRSADYEQCREDCHEAGVRLQRIYALDTALAEVARMAAGSDDLAVLHLADDAVQVLGWRDGRPGPLVGLPLGMSTLQRSLAAEDSEDLSAMYREAIDAQRLSAQARILITGLHSDDEAVCAWLGRACARDLATWRQPVLGEGGPWPTFAAALAGGLRELNGRSGRLVGLSDALPLQTRIKRRVHALPVVLSSLVVVLLLLHYAWIRHQERSLSARLSSLQADIANREAALEILDERRAQQARFSRTYRDLSQEAQFLAEEEPAARRILAWAAEDCARLAPPGLRLLRLESPRPSSGERGIVIEGSTHDATLPNRYALALAEQPWCLAVDLPHIGTTPGGQSPRRAAPAGDETCDPLLYFTYTLTLRSVLEAAAEVDE